MTRQHDAALPAGLGVVYACPECEAYYLDERRCPDCQLFCRRLDVGGLCPHCDEPVPLSALVADDGHVRGGDAPT